MVRKLLRGADAFAGAIASWARIARFRAFYPGLRVGRGVTLRRGVRLRVLNGATLTIGDRAMIEANAELHSDGALTIGADAFIGSGAMLVAAEGIAIGRDALIAERVTIRDQDHATARDAGPYRRQGRTAVPISIGDNVWIGAGAVVLKGVAIGDDCVIGANAVVTKSLARGSRAVGNPARSIA